MLRPGTRSRVAGEGSVPAGVSFRSVLRWLGDGVLAVIVFLLILDQGSGGVPELGVFGGLPQPGQTLVAAVVATSVPVRRRWPYALLVTGTAALIVTTAPWGLVISAYTLSAQTRRPRLYPVFAWGLPVLVFARLLVAGASAAYALVLTVLVIGTPTLLGLWASARRALLETLRERAERLEREQRVLADRARGQERARIAREMHDVVAHRVSLMVLHAGALEVTLADRNSAQQARMIRETGREALTELREVLSVLREQGQSAAVEPQPTFAALEGLVRQSREAGLPVSVEVEGEPRDLPATVERAVFRLMQEALTNIHKYAAGAPTMVKISYLPDRLKVSVRNARAVRGPSTDLARSGSGQGHHGLRERIDLLGGTFDAGPRLDAGYEVRATIPT